METRNILAIFLIALVLVIAGVFFYMALQWKVVYTQCQTEESPWCFTFTCQNSTTTCKNFSYRCSKPGKVRCSNAPLIDVDIDLSDDICTTSSDQP